MTRTICGATMPHTDSGPGGSVAAGHARYPARQRYAGEVARGYVGRRAVTAKWQREQRLVEDLIAKLPAASSVLDVPLGTGRFLAAYARSDHRVVGVDISSDMLREAAGAAARPGDLRVVRGEAERLPLADGAVDFVVSTRFLNWLPTPMLAAVLTELLRVARHGAIVQVRVAEPFGRARMLGRLLRRPGWLGGAARRLRRTAAATWARLAGRASGYTVHPAGAVTAALTAAGATVEAQYVIGRRLDLAHGQVHELRVYRVRAATAAALASR